MSTDRKEWQYQMQKMPYSGVSIDDLQAIATAIESSELVYEKRVLSIDLRSGGIAMATTGEMRDILKGAGQIVRLERNANSAWNVVDVGRWVS